MSKNAVVDIKAINAALSVDARDFSSSLFFTKNYDVKSVVGNLPVAITRVSDLETYGIKKEDTEYIILTNYFGADPSPDMIWVYGEKDSAYTDIITGLDTRWANNWFYTTTNFVNQTEAKEIGDAFKGLSNEYMVLLQGLPNLTVEDNIGLPSNIKDSTTHYIASDVSEGQSAALIGTVRTFFPGSIPYSTIKINGVTGCNYSLGERINLVGSAGESSTGVNLVHEEDRLVIAYYGKSTDGVTWTDYAAAKIAIDDYMRKGITQYIVQRNTSGKKIPGNATGALQIIAEGTRILTEFSNREIIYGQGEVDEDGNPLFGVSVVEISNRTAKIKYQCVFQGAIIKAEVEISLTNRGGN